MVVDINISKKRANLLTHVCDLAKSSNSNLPKLPPNAKIHNRWRRSLQKLVLVSARHPLTRSVLRSRAAIAFEKRRHAKSPHRWVIHPCSMLRFYWDTIMAVTFLYLFTTVPYITCFYRIGKSSGPESWNIVYPAYAVCIVDILLNFMTGFVSVDGHEIFLDAAIVTRHYVRGYFFVDLLSSISYTWFYPLRILPSGPDSNPALLIAEFLPFLKITRMSTLRRNIQQINAMCSISQTKKTTIWLVIVTLLIIHWSGCISYIFPYIIMHIQGRSMQDSDTFSSTQLYNKPIWKIYLVFVHIGASNLVGSSSIEFEKFGILDRLLRCILLLCGKGYMIYLIVTILQLLESSAEPELKYQRIMHQVKEYIHQKRLPRHLQDKLISYYEYRYQGSFFKENIISDTLSNHLNREILLHSGRRLLNNTILRNLTHSVVLSDLMSLLKPVIYLEQDVIYKAGTESDCMYFIASGTVVLITFSGKEICHLHDGDHFGETVLIYPDQSRTESVIALEVCELLRLDRRDFKCLFPPKSEFHIKLKQVAQEHLQKIDKLNEPNLSETKTT